MPGLKGETVVRNVASEGLDFVRSNPIKKLKESWTMDSIIIAIAFNGLSCDVHEDCDATCSEGPQYAGVLLLEGLATDIVLDAFARHVPIQVVLQLKMFHAIFVGWKSRIFLNSSTLPAVSNFPSSYKINSPILN